MRLSELYQVAWWDIPYALMDIDKKIIASIGEEENKMKRCALSLFVLILLLGCAPQAPTPISIEPMTGQSAPDLERPAEAAPPAPRQPEPVVIVPAPTQALLAKPYLYEEEESGPAYPRGNTFQDYGSNPEKRPDRDHLSTFGLDVDTAAYTIARRYLNDGLLPPPESVRIEEFVNYFKQDYPSPDGVAFGIYADGAPSPFSMSDELVVRFGIQGYQPLERKPLALTFVIDISGSMNLESRLGLVKRSLELLLDQLQPGDTVGIVVYGSNARVVLQPTDARSQQKIKKAIRALKPEGRTNVEAGLVLGFRLARQNFRSETVNRVILCSDGVANVGSVTAEEILVPTRYYSQGEIPLSTYGFGMGNYNDVLMEQLANQGDGEYAYVDTIEQAESLFVEELTQSFEVIARNAKVQVDFNPDLVASFRLLGYENREIADEDFRNDGVDAGELGAGHSVTALYLVRLHPGVAGRIATFQMRWEDPNTWEVKEINGNFNTWSTVEQFSAASARYQLDVLAAYYAGQLRYDEWAMDADWYDLVRYARQVAKKLRADADVVEFARLVEQASELTGY
jgi:Ca-activated chloride channel homolog